MNCPLDIHQFHKLWRDHAATKRVEGTRCKLQLHRLYVRAQPEQAVHLYGMPYTSIELYISPPLTPGEGYAAMLVIGTIDDGRGVCRGPSESLQKAEARLKRMIQWCFQELNPTWDELQGFCNRCGLYADLG